MRSIVLVALGAAVGAYAVTRMQRTPKGREMLDGADARVREFTDAVRDGYASRDRELRGE
ncbi:hypothetical protein GCM10009846_15320 [Agrococcus versicolor]|uniref:YtxH domain-containing protein n=1 Tax=Agrococcus versicolor TaxID=501482 RepID=A0ABP5MHE0_9MICO